jgi:hypothetical protein
VPKVYLAVRVASLACEYTFASIFAPPTLLVHEPGSYKLAVSKARKVGMFCAATPAA